MQEDRICPPFSIEAKCDSCHTSCRVMAPTASLLFCPFCGKNIDASHQKTLIPNHSSLSSSDETVSFIQEHLPQDVPVKFTIGPYQVLRSIGKGGMGEVFLAYDTICGRRIALKRIRVDLADREHMHARFLREALITCQLTHPAIIPIYVIHGEDNLVYYTMPYVAGDTLKQVLRKTRQQDKNGEPLDHVGASIPALIRIFITICQAIAYAHSKKVIHRDLKPENIILGKYGEVLILDWGLAKVLESEDSEDEESFLPTKLPAKNDVTSIGKVVGTISYMAPERALGQSATLQTDIYSLGIILYQLLSLRQPFRRGNLEEFRKTMAKEELIDPALAAPYRDVPPILSRITEKCLSTDLEQRYQTVDQLIHDLEDYTEGRSEWYSIVELDTQQKDDWEFQENVLIAEHMAITRISEEADWVSLMISQDSFSGNTKIEADVTIGEKGHGIGFLMSIPEASERIHLNDGYCLWLGSDMTKTTKLLRNSVEVLHAPDIFLKRHQKYRVRIEKIDQTIHFYLNDKLQFSYIAYLPMIGTHVGLLSRDWDFEISTINISVGSLSVSINCLSVPDTFLAHKDFHKALSEYRRIANSFSGRAEGREALFRAGITLIEEARDSNEKANLLELALDEFEKLHKTPGAPLEYLGKALVYQAMNDYEEEIKCYELAYRRYAKHPLLPILQEQIIARMHEMSRYDRYTTYQFILLSVRNLPFSDMGIHTHKLFKSLQKHWEPIYFMLENDDELKLSKAQHYSFETLLAFWLAKPYVLGEILDDLIRDKDFSLTSVGNVVFSLLELGCVELAKKKLLDVEINGQLPELDMVRLALEEKESLADSLNTFFSANKTNLTSEELRTLLYLLERALAEGKPDLVHQSVAKLEHCGLSFENSLSINIIQISSYLWEKNWTRAGELIDAYPLELLNKDSTPLHYLYGCWLNVIEGKELALIHFSGVLDTPYPRSWTLISHYLSKKIHPGDSWFQKAFLWEKRQLYKQLALYYHCGGEEEQSQYFQNLQKEQYIHAEP